jgi:hypothetical protein
MNQSETDIMHILKSCYKNRMCDQSKVKHIKYFYSLAPIFVVSTKCSDTCVLGCFKHYRQKSMGKLFFIGFLFSWFKYILVFSIFFTISLNIISNTVKSLLIVRF